MSDSPRPTPDGQAIALLCAHLGPRRSDAPVKPLSTPEWVRFGRQIAASEWKRPGALLGSRADEIASTIGVESDLAERVVRLLGRGTLLSSELDRLASRGIWMVTRADPGYPANLKRQLAAYTPPVLFGAGPPDPMSADGVAVVGSRDVDEAGHSFAGRLGARLGEAGWAVFSGAARGVDRAAMDGCMDAGGVAVGVVSESLEKMLAGREIRQRVLARQVTLLTPDHPGARFTAAGAMARNKLIYCLASYAVVVASAKGKGGTWAGAVENLKHGWVPLFVRTGPGVPPGNEELVARGGVPVGDEDLANAPQIGRWFGDRAPERGPSGRGGRNRQVDRHPQPPAVPPEVRASDEGAPHDLLGVVWPHMQNFLRIPRTPDEVASAFRVERKQAADWLRRATEAGWADLAGRPPRYRTAVQQPDAEQTALFGAGHE